MVRITISLIALTMALGSIGCGKGPNGTGNAGTASHGACYGPANGRWQAVSTGYTLTVNEDCTGSSTVCNEVFTAHPQSNGSVILITTQTNGGPSCLNLGSTTCNFSMLPNFDQLSILCSKGGIFMNTNYNRL